MKNSTSTVCTMLSFGLLTATAAAAAVAPRSTPSNSSTSRSSLIWTDCSSTYGQGFTCSNLTVPLDWSKPSGEKITLGMNRFQSNSSSGNHKLNLLVNYGGPGGIATQTLPPTLPGFSDDILSHFDLVAVDPRGIGTSTPLQCSVDLWNERISLFPQTQAEFDRLVQRNTAFGKSCIAQSGNLIYHMDTKSVARDFEAVRIALGGEALNFFGLSYGSQIAYQYAQLFPNNIRTLLGDGILNHADSETSFFITETETYEDSFDRFAAWAGQSNESALQGQDVGALFDQLIETANKQPIPVGSGDGHFANVTGEEILFNLQGLLLTKEALLGPGWAAISDALALALTGNGTALADLAPAAVAGETEANSILFSGLAVGCADQFHSSSSVSDLLYKQELAKIWAPHTQGHTQSRTIQTRCIGWPAPIANPPEQIDVDTKTPILLVASTHDPETSYTWAVEVQAQIPSSVLLTRDGDGHTSYFLGGEITAAMNAYLVNGTVPAANVVLSG